MTTGSGVSVGRGVSVSCGSGEGAGSTCSVVFQEVSTWLKCREIPPRSALTSTSSRTGRPASLGVTSIRQTSSTGRVLGSSRRSSKIHNSGSVVVKSSGDFWYHLATDSKAVSRACVGSIVGWVGSERSVATSPFMEYRSPFSLVLTISSPPITGIPSCFCW